MSNNTNIYKMARTSVKYVPLHEEYEAIATSDVSGSSKKGKISEHADSDNQSVKSEGGGGVDETRKSKRRRVTSTKILEALENGSALIVGASARESRKKFDKKDAGGERSKQWRRYVFYILTFWLVLNLCH